MNLRRVKITGIGPVTPAGVGREAFARGINESVSRARKLTGFDESGGEFLAALVDDSLLQAELPLNGQARKLPRHTQFALAATKLALDDAGLSLEDVKRMRPLLVSGTLLMDVELLTRSIVQVQTKGPRHSIPAVVAEAPASSVTAKMAAFIGGPCATLTIQSGCCAGLDAIAMGAIMIASGRANLAICCGTEAPASYQPLVELNVAGLSPKNASRPEEMGRPFDLWRDAGVIGEGACAVVLEAEDSPRQAYAWIGGYGQEHDSLGPKCNGLVGSMRLALADAGCRPEEVDLINAWGPGHEEVDRTEAASLREVFGKLLGRIPAVSIKGAVGNALAAAGAIQVGSAALSLRTGCIPPTVNWETADPECPLNLSKEPREIGCSVALINAHGINGQNSSIILRHSR